SAARGLTALTPPRELLRPGTAPRILTVTQLATLLRERLERDFGRVWVAGEISNLRAQPTGHVYLTLEDDQSELSGVMFRAAAQVLQFRPVDGMEVVACGRVSVYIARGALQFYVDTLEPRGLGAL